MQVIFGDEQKALIGERYTILELDTFMQAGMSNPVTAYAVLGLDDFKIQDIPVMENFVNLHNTMLKEYKKKNWNFCFQALEHLRGKWNGSLDSFYDVFESRINELSTAQLDESWTGIIYK